MKSEEIVLFDGKYSPHTQKQMEPFIHNVQLEKREIRRIRHEVETRRTAELDRIVGKFKRQESDLPVMALILSSLFGCEEADLQIRRLQTLA
jgi:hypothetical protein